MNPARAPRVFLSYSHDSEPHRDAVLSLANRLRTDGIDAWLDRYELLPRMGWIRWMQQQVTEADFVLIICTSVYQQRFDSFEDLGVGKGVTFESLLARQALYDSGMQNGKFLPILLSDVPEETVPYILRSYQRFQLNTDPGYETLLRVLTHQPAVVPPPVGAKLHLPPQTDFPASPQQVSRSNGLPAPENDSAIFKDILSSLEEMLNTSVRDRGAQGDALLSDRQTWNLALLHQGAVTAGMNIFIDDWVEAPNTYTPQMLVERVQGVLIETRALLIPFSNRKIGKVYDWFAEHYPLEHVPAAVLKGQENAAVGATTSHKRKNLYQLVKGIQAELTLTLRQDLGI